MERVLTLKESFMNGIAETQNPDGSFKALNVGVCNMSLGGHTLYAGRDLEDELTQAFLQRDIVLVVASGNAGPSGTTNGSPATGFGALTVGASSSAVHERILRDLQRGPGGGLLFRPFGGTQTAYFSSRGPNADGRPDPDVVANGFGSFGQGFSDSPVGIDIAAGTSLSSPSVAGVAAVLRQATPGATARQVRNALILSANANLIHDGSGQLDIGAGQVDGAAALVLLKSGSIPDTPGETGGTNSNVKVNIEQGAGIKTFTGNVTRSVSGLLPGQRFETYYRVTPNTSSVVVMLTGVTPGQVQNQLFGDDILLTVHSAKTSSIGEGDYKVFGFTRGGTFAIPNPELGLMRVTVSGDWTNASPIGATVTIFSMKDSLPQATDQGHIKNGTVQVLPFQVRPGVSKLSARLEWDGDWSSYPANDVDLILIRPNGTANFTGATLNSPEIAEETSPPAGNWLAIVDGFTVYGKQDKFKLRIALDGQVVK
jgi:hypothetical protein